MERGVLRSPLRSPLRSVLRPAIIGVHRIIVNGHFADPNIVFTRASANGTEYDAAGDIAVKGTNVARRTHDPVTLAPLGFLMEEARTQLLDATECSDAGIYWEDSSGATSTDLTGDILGQFIGVSVASGGSAIAKLKTADGKASTSGVMQSWTAFYQAGTSGKVTIQFIIEGNDTSSAAGTIGSIAEDLTGAGPVVVLSETLLADGVTWMAQGTWVPDATDTETKLAIGPFTTTIGETVIAVAGELEVGTLPTSLLLSTIAAVTRAKDVASLALGNWWNATGNTFKVGFNADYADSGRVLFEVSDGTADDFLKVVEHSDGKVRIETNIGGAGVTGTSSTIAFIAASEIIITFDTAEVRFSVDGEAEVTHAASGLAVSTFDQDDIGQDTAAANQLNGTILDKIQYPRVFTSAEVSP